MTKTQKRKIRPLISIITLTRNIETCTPLLKSIARQKRKDVEVIIVVQKKSIRDCHVARSSLLAMTKVNKIRILTSRRDPGFCTGNNRAAKRARGKYLFFLNDDTELAPNCLDALVRRITNYELRITGKRNREKNRIAVIQPKIRSSIHPEFFEYAGAAGGFIDQYGYCFCRGRIFFTIEEDVGQYDHAPGTESARIGFQSVEIGDPKDIFWASGAAFFIRKDIFTKFNGFDKRFFAYHEETDLCWRLKHAGYRIIYEPTAVVYHQGESSWKLQRFRKIFLIHRNHYWMLAKNYSLIQFFRILPMKLFLDVAAVCYYLRYHTLKDAAAATIGSLSGILQCFPFLSFHPPLKVTPFKVYPGSIAIAYFLKGKKTYHELMGHVKPKGVRTLSYGKFREK